MTMVNREDIAEWLMGKGYLLTALEFYQEMLEDDGSELEVLKDYFIKHQPNFDQDSPRFKVERRSSRSMDESPLFHHHHHISVGGGSTTTTGTTTTSPGAGSSNNYNSNYNNNNNSNSNMNELVERLKEKDEKVSLLEYELRRAREDITNLRTQLTNIVKKSQHHVVTPTTTATTASATPSSLSPTPNSSSASSFSPSSNTVGSGGEGIDEQIMLRLQRENIREHEKKILNYLIKNYLVQNKYSLTAITFAEEMSEELTTWDSVGLDTMEPPPLLSLYRYFFDNEEAGIQGALAKSINEASKLKKELGDKDVEYRATKKKMVQYQKDNEALQAKIKEMGAAIDDLKQGVNPTSTALLTKFQQQSTDSNSNIAPPQTISPSTTPTPPINTTQQDAPILQCAMRAAFKNLVHKKRAFSASAPPTTTISNKDIDSPEAEASARIAQEVARIPALEGEQQVVVRIVADCLPHIVPGVLLNKREELIPIILVTISQHPSNTDRFALTKLLFNLIKKPNLLQRQVIMNGCIALASIIGPQRTETELLTQCWEQIGDKHAERRVLVADSCGQLALYVQPSLRVSLILSILQQMVEDRTGLVRAAVARNLSLLVNCLENGEKYPQVEELFMRLLWDSEPMVVVAARRYLLPALVHWTDTFDSFHSKLLNMLLTELQSTIMKSGDGGGNNDTANKLTEKDLKQVELILACFVSLIPRLKEVVFASNPAISAKEASVIESQSIANLVSVQALTTSATPVLPTSTPTLSSPTVSSPSLALTPTPNSTNTTSTSTTTSSSTPTLKQQITRTEGEGVVGGQQEDGSGEESVVVNLNLLSDKACIKLKTAFDTFITTQPEGFINTKDWPMLDWVVNELLPRLISITVAVPISQSSSILLGLAEVVRSLCTNFGIPFTKKAIKSAFAAEINSSVTGVEPAKSNGSRRKVLLLPVYLSGVLTTLDDAEMIKFLHELIVNISVEENGWTHGHMPVLKEVIAQLSVQQSNFNNITAAIISNNTKTNNVNNITNNPKAYIMVDTLCDMVAHPSNQVRSCVVSLFNVAIPAAKSSDLVNKILPALITLSNDPDPTVRLGCIDPLANIVVNSPNSSTDDVLADKLTGAFDRMLEDEAHGTKLATVRALSNIIPHLTLKLKFRDSYIVPKLVEQTRKNNQNQNLDQRKEMANALFEAFRTLVSSSLSKEVIEEQVLPGLKLLLLVDGGQGGGGQQQQQPLMIMDATFKTMVQSMINDIMESNNPSNNNNATTHATAEKEQSSEKSSTRRNILGKLDAASLTSLKVDFDKALPKWTWKNR